MIEANYDEVICPNCVTQFRAIPVNVQDTLRKQDAVLKMALESFDSIRCYGLDTLSGRTDGPDDRGWQRAAVNEMAKRARLAIAAIQEQIK